MRLGTGEILLILAAVLLIFGPSRLPQLGDAIGRGIRSFKKATSADPEFEDREARVLPVKQGEPR